MALTHIEYGALASSETMNDNFDYLDNRISTVADSLSSNTSSIYSNIASLGGTVSAQIEDIVEDVSELAETVDGIRDDIDSENNAPDYNRVVSITLPYTVTQRGYVYGGVYGLDANRYVYVNGKIVHGHCGYSGGIGVYSGSLFRVSPGDVITVDWASAGYYFYPMKGD